MSGSALAASLVGSLVWPALVAAALIGFREPLKDLIGRLKSAKVAGQEFEFGPNLRDAEEKADAAISDASVPPDREKVRPPLVLKQYLNTRSRWESRDFLVEGPGLGISEETPWEPTPYERAERARSAIGILARDGETSPSLAIVQAWERLSTLLRDYAAVVLPKSLLSYPLAPQLQKLQQQGEVTASFVDAVQDVRGLRNAVAHGEHNPTPGEAVAYVDTVAKLAYVAALQRAQFEEAHEPRSDDAKPDSAKSAEAESSGDGSSG
jgi:hypothetical protein